MADKSQLPNYLVMVVTGIAFLIYKLYTPKRVVEKLPYKRREYLTVPERHFFEGLQKIVPSDYAIFPQVVISSIIEAKSGKEFWRFENKINRKTIDFVIFRKADYTPVLAIEYDDSSHLRKTRKERDSFVNDALDAAGIAIKHVKHKANIDYEVLSGEIKKILASIQ